MGCRRLPNRRNLVLDRADPRPATEEATMATLHVENTVRDYDSWKSVFDKFDRQRRDRGVRSYRINRAAEDPNKVIIDMEFDSTTRAEEFREFLGGVMSSPQSHDVLVDHRPLVILDVAEEQTLS
jgi:hypothetical protein